MPVILVTSDPRKLAPLMDGPPDERPGRTPWVSNINPCYSKFKVTQMLQQGKPNPNAPRKPRVHYASPIMRYLPEQPHRSPGSTPPRCSPPPRKSALAAHCKPQPQPQSQSRQPGTVAAVSVCSPNYRNAVSGAQAAPKARAGAKRAGDAGGDSEANRNLPSVKFFGGKMIMHMRKK